MQPIARHLLLALALTASACSGGDSVTGLGTVIGRVELSDGNIASDACIVRVQGMPKGARCDAKGHFELTGMPPGRWHIEIEPEGELRGLPGRRIAIGVNENFVSDAGLITLFGPGAIGGRLIGSSTAGLESAIVALPGFGVFTGPTPQNAYLLTLVPPGTHDVLLILSDRSYVAPGVDVVSRKTTTGVDFVLADGVTGPGTIRGTALREDNTTDTLTVELVDALDGVVLDSTRPASDGNFSFETGPGAYLVQAHEPGNPVRARAPDIYLAAQTEFEIPYTLWVPLAREDCDGDGVVAPADTDDDNDGILDDVDPFLCDASVGGDADNDGVPDDIDVRNNDNPDPPNPTPDSDADGKFDFEDNCVYTPNPLQLDSDGDEFGDACDVCPSVHNPRQDPGACISPAPECEVDAHCDGRVCVNNICQDCANDDDCMAPATCAPDGHCTLACEENTDCSEGLVCDVANAVCVQCLEAADCGGGGTCKTPANTCVECLTTADCSGASVCDQDQNTCVECLTTDDCSTGVCDEPNRTCVECLVDQDCAAGSCNTMTHTCSGCTLDSDCGDSQHCKNPGTAGECVDCVTDGHCDDGLYCTGAESCEADHCVPGQPPDLDDGIACTVDTCNEATDQIDHVPDNGLCNDDNPCTTDACTGAGCESTATVLIWNGTGETQQILSVAVDLLPGHTPVLTDTENEFIQAYNQTPDVLLIDSPAAPLPLGVKSRIQDWAGFDQPLVISAPTDLATDSTFRAALGISAATLNPSLAPPVTLRLGTVGEDLFSSPEDVPDPLGDALPSFAETAVSLEGGEEIVDYPLTNTAIVTTNNRRFIINGFSSRSFALSPLIDQDSDEQNDMAELLANEISFVCKPPSHGLGLHRRLALGYAHTCALTEAGAVRCWGSGSNGTLGSGLGNAIIGDDEFPAESLDVKLPGPAVSLAAGTGHTCALMEAGTVHCWGSNASGQLGIPNVTHIGNDEHPGDVAPVNVGGTAVHLAAGGNHTCVIRDDEAIVCWGSNEYGELGYGHTNIIGDNEHPASAGVISLHGGVPPVALALGTQHTCALSSDGEVQCWGHGGLGALGLASTEDIGDDELPGSVSFVQVGADVVGIGAGDQHSCAVVSNGDTRCWGHNMYHTLGTGNIATIGDDEHPSTVPYPGVGGLVAQIEGGIYETCALLTDGTVKCWGENYNGLLGYGHQDTVDPPTLAPVLSIGGPVIEIGVGFNRQCALLANDRLRCWGYGGHGALGYGNTENIGDDEVPSEAGDVRWLPEHRRGISRLAAAEVHTCAVTPEHKLRCWGTNSFGETGAGAAQTIGDLDIAARAGRVDLGDDVLMVAAKSRTTCTVTTNRQVRCFGLNSHGQLGYGHTDNVGDNEPPSSHIAVGSNVVEVAVGQSHTCSRDGFGIVRCWGLGDNSRLGNGSNNDGLQDANAATPVPLGGLATQIVAGADHTCALLTDGVVRCWGAGGFGQLGNSSLFDVGAIVPVADQSVMLGGTAVKLAAGWTHTCALLTTGGVRCWGGDNATGALGYGIPVALNQTPELSGDVQLLQGAKDIWAGDNHTCARLNDDSLRCWGENIQGALGVGNTDRFGDDETPLAAAAVNTGGNVEAMGLGAHHSCAFLERGTLHCWGRGFDGALGHGHANDIGDDESARSFPPVPWRAAYDRHLVSHGTHSLARVSYQGAQLLHSWGDNLFGGLGLGHEDNIGDDETPQDAGPVPVPFGDILCLAAGYQHSCAVSSDRDAYCWGAGDDGQLGYGNQDHLGDNESVGGLAAVPLPGKVRSITAGTESTCALMENGEVRCWGSGSSGALGLGTSIGNLGDDELVPTVGAINLGGPVSQVSTGTSHSCVLRDDNKVYCWGYNALGQLGYGHQQDIGDDESPVSAGPLDLGEETILQLGVGLYHNCVLYREGNVRCWGYGLNGALGYGNTQDIGDNEPPYAGGDLDLPGPAKALYVGPYHNCVILAGGDVVCWGQNATGELGRGHVQTIGDDETPNGTNAIVPLPGPAMELAVGTSFTCAMLEDATVYCWGYGAQGALGYGNTDSIGDNEPADSGGPLSF